MSGGAIIVATLFGAKILWNLGLPYVLVARSWRASGRQGISVVPIVELVLLGAAFVLDWANVFVWPWGPGRLLVIGAAMIAGCYVHACVVLGIWTRVASQPR